MLFLEPDVYSRILAVAGAGVRRRRIRKGPIVGRVVRRNIIPHDGDRRKAGSARDGSQRDVHHIVAKAATVWPSRWNRRSCTLIGRDRISADEAKPVKARVTRRADCTGRRIHADNIRDEDRLQIGAIRRLEVLGEYSVDKNSQFGVQGIPCKAGGIGRRGRPVVVILIGERHEAFVEKRVPEPVDLDK